jgi:hypothetical protein
MTTEETRAPHPCNHARPLPPETVKARMVVQVPRWADGQVTGWENARVIEVRPPSVEHNMPKQVVVVRYLSDGAETIMYPYSVGPASGGCEHGTKVPGGRCRNPYAYWVQVATVPQPLGPNGVYGHEGPDAGRNQLVCGLHLPTAVRELLALPIRRPGAPVTVTEQHPAEGTR